MLEETLIKIMKSYQYLARDLEMVKQLGLPNWYIAAGYVRNRVWDQARMHIQNNDDPYHSVTEAMSKWPETVTAVGITMEEDGKVQLIAPYGVEDIFEMTVRRSPLFKDRYYYRRRLHNKNWQEIWPKIKIDWD